MRHSRRACLHRFFFGATGFEEGTNGCEFLILGKVRLLEDVDSVEP